MTHVVSCAMVSYNLQSLGKRVDELFIERTDVGQAVVVDGRDLTILAIGLALVEEGLAVGGVELLRTESGT